MLRLRGPVTVWLALTAACGRIDYAPGDTAESIDASLDAAAAPDAAMDAPGLDAFSPDAADDAALDAPIAIDAGRDIGPVDAGDTCLRATAQWLLGTGPDSVDHVVITRDDGVVIGGQVSNSGLLPGLTSGAFLARIDDGGGLVWQDASIVNDVARQGDSLLVLRGSTLDRVDGASGAMMSTLGTVMPAFANGSGAVVPRPGGGAVIALVPGGALSWNGTSIVTSTMGATDVAIVVVDGAGTVIGSSVGGSGDNDTVNDLVAAGDRYFLAGLSNTAPSCFGPATCTTDAGDFLLQLDGDPPTPSRFLPRAVTAGAYSLVADAAGNLFGAGQNAIVGMSVSGTVRFSHPTVTFPAIAYDAGRDRVVVAGRLISATTIDGTTISPLGPRESLVVLARRGDGRSDRSLRRGRRQLRSGGRRRPRRRHRARGGLQRHAVRDVPRRRHARARG
ncbi:MAG: hypothetical protein J0L92_04605 [Deltaproteobacteria bacterium]|nr:hypothetical protein [Deltaproteobacteria bacterium]